MAKAIRGKLKEKLVEYALNPDSKYPLSPEMKVVKVRVWEIAAVGLNTPMTQNSTLSNYVEGGLPDMSKTLINED